MDEQPTYAAEAAPSEPQQPGVAEALAAAPMPTPPAPKPGDGNSATYPVTPEPVLEGPVFRFRKRTEDEDPIVPFVFNEQQFHLHPRRINALVAADFTVAMDSQPMWEFFEGVMGDEYPRFRRAVRDPLLIIEAEDMKALIKWMVEASADRPT